MAHMLVNGINVYYEVHGEGEPLVLIAGFCADHTSWDEVIGLFKAHYQVIVFDNRGAGQTDVPLDAYSVETMADDIAALCGELSVHKAHFIGHSMGGFILQSLAYRYPALVASATISHSTFRMDTCFHIYAAAQLAFIKAGMPARALIQASCAWVYSFQFLSQPGMLDYVIQLGLDKPYPCSIQGYEGQYAALDQFDSRDWAHKIQIPTLVLTSDNDLIFSETSVTLLVNAIAGAQYVCFSDCGHIPQRECPKPFYDVVHAFLQSVSG